MSNSYFRFRQFTIHQDRCAMKVSTDACIQGAWTTVQPGTKRILDIGTGTGLLAMMLAQKTDAVIDAIELDNEAAVQAGENVAGSLWKNRVHIIHADALTYEYQHHYELIIANPPFFNNSLLGNKASRNYARHTLTMGYENLFEVMRKSLSDGGEVSIILPADSFGLWEAILEKNNWQVSKKLHVYPGVERAANRVAAICKPGHDLSTIEEDLFIRGDDDSYTTHFTTLLHPYYLDR